jgi:hypothetical protein
MNGKRGWIGAALLGAALLAGYLWWQGQAVQEAVPITRAPEPVPPPGAGSA